MYVCICMYIRMYIYCSFGVNILFDLQTFFVAKIRKKGKKSRRIQGIDIYTLTCSDDHLKHFRVARKRSDGLKKSFCMGNTRKFDLYNLFTPKN